MQPDLKLAASLFDTLDRATRRGRGISRDSYGAGEQAAHDIVRSAAEALALEIRIDAIGNLLMTLPGQDRSAPRILIGSHLDSSPQSGNYDGAAGVVAGLAVLSALRQSGQRPGSDITVMAIRGEESSWFNISYIGSNGAFGLLDPACLATPRSDNGQSFESALLAGGFDPGAIRDRRVLLAPAGIRGYVELHIEQGPVLVAGGLPAAAVTGIRGCRRFRDARCFGAYGHSGAVDRPYRQDAVAATVALLHHLESTWLRLEASGADLTITTGELSTDPALHAPSKISGETRFVIDIRSIRDAVMDDVVDDVRRAAIRIGEAYRVRFELGETVDSPAATMDPRLRTGILAELAQPFEMASGAGHDAAVFAKMGVPTGMIFVRNQNGSHNPDEAMNLDDFDIAASALLNLLLRFPLP